MGRDLRQVGFNRNVYTDRCEFYGSDCIELNKIKPDAKPLGRFYKKDLVAFAYQKLDLGGGVFSNDLHFIGTIETLDHVEQLRLGMYVKDQTGMLFKVVPPLISDDADKSKVVGRRPTIKTTIKLVGVERK